MDTALYVAAAVAFGLAAFGVTVKKVNLIALGLLLWILPTLI